MLASLTSHKREGDNLGKQEETRMRKQEKPKKNWTRKEENERETTQRSQGTQKTLQILTNLTSDHYLQRNQSCWELEQHQASNIHTPAYPTFFHVGSNQTIYQWNCREKSPQQQCIWR